MQVDAVYNVYTRRARGGQCAFERALRPRENKRSGSSLAAKAIERESDCKLWVA